MGPTTKAISVTGGVTFPELVDNFYYQAHALIEGGADVLLLETCQDTRTVKAALVAIERLRQELGESIPIMVSATIEAAGTMLAGQTADAFCASVAHADLLSIGLNCATGPEFMTDHLRTHQRDVAVPRFLLSQCGPAGRRRKVCDDAAVAGGATGALRAIAAGSTWWADAAEPRDAHSRAIAQMAEGKRPRQVPAPLASLLLFRYRAGGSRREQSRR